MRNSNLPMRNIIYAKMWSFSFDLKPYLINRIHSIGKLRSIWFSNVCCVLADTARHDSIDAACDQPQPTKIPDQYFSRQSEITNNSNDKLFDTLFFRVNNNANSVDMLIILFCMLDQTKQEILMTSMPHTRAHISSQPKTLARFVQL